MPSPSASFTGPVGYHRTIGGKVVMHSRTMGELRDRCAGFLAAHRFGILNLPSQGWAMPVRFRSRDLVVACLLPRWAEIEFRLEEDAGVLLIVPGDEDARCWLACRGHARIVTLAWPELLPDGPLSMPSSELYRVIEITPVRFDLVDERVGWGWCENLDL